MQEGKTSHTLMAEASKYCVADCSTKNFNVPEESTLSCHINVGITFARMSRFHAVAKCKDCLRNVVSSQAADDGAKVVCTVHLPDHHSSYRMVSHICHTNFVKISGVSMNFPMFDVELVHLV